MKKNISVFKHCYGCGVCVPSCPVKIITYVLNEEGFYSPKINDENKCIECGICLKVCAFNHSELSQDIKEINSFSGWSNDEFVRNRCSSGGVGYEIGRLMINKGAKVVSVRYNVKKQIAEHYLSSSIEHFKYSIGSKYLPSFSVDAFLKINRTDKYLVVGTPCQIDSFRRYINHLHKEDNFILLDFFCHGVPSMFLWKKYLSIIKKTNGEPVFVSWRNKNNGWHDSWAISMDFIQGNRKTQDNYYDLASKEADYQYSSLLTKGDLFFKLFLGNFCLNRCCYKNCKYKMCSSAADIRIGDLWGNLYEKEEKGVNAVLGLTDSGKQILQELAEKMCTLHEHNIETVCEGQMRTMPIQPVLYKLIIQSLKSKLSLNHIDHTLILAQRVISKVRRTVL